MLRYAVRHIKKKADMNLLNNAKLSPLTLACKLGRLDMFNAIMELLSYVRHYYRRLICKSAKNAGTNL